MAKEKAKSGKPEGEQEGLLSQDEMDDLAVLDLDPGGPTPSKSILKVGSHTKEIANQFKQEEEVIFQVHARCEEVGFKGPKRIHEFDVLDIFQDEDLDVDLVERFKDKLEDYDCPAKTKAAIDKFLDSCVADGHPDAPAAGGEPAEAPDGGEAPEAAGAKAEEPSAPPAGDESPDAGEPPAEEVDGEIVDEGQEAAMDEAAGDLDWSEE